MRNADLDRRVSIEKHNAIDENKLPVKTRFSGCFYFILFFYINRSRNIRYCKFCILQIYYTIIQYF